jgi:hypothetical protein
MGETGPCGPCTEIFYDHGAEIAGGPPGSPDEDGDRYVEIWNLVFMQYDRSSDGTLVPLPKPSVDTGMGLERVAAVMQGVHTNYDIDLFKTLIRAAAEVTGTEDLESSSLRVIADHIRACALFDYRRRGARQGRARLRAPAHYSTRHTPWPQTGSDAAVFPQAGADAGARNGLLLHRTRDRRGAGHSSAGTGRGALCGNPDHRYGAARCRGRQIEIPPSFPAKRCFVCTIRMAFRWI